MLIIMIRFQKGFIEFQIEMKPYAKIMKPHHKMKPAQTICSIRKNQKLILLRQSRRDRINDFVLIPNIHGQIENSLIFRKF